MDSTFDLIAFLKLILHAAGCVHVTSFDHLAETRRLLYTPDCCSCACSVWIYVTGRQASPSAALSTGGAKCGADLPHIGEHSGIPQADDRRIAEAHYKLALTLHFLEDPERALEHANKAVAICSARIARLSQPEESVAELSVGVSASQPTLSVMQV